MPKEDPLRKQVERLIGKFGLRIPVLSLSSNRVSEALYNEKILKVLGVDGSLNIPTIRRRVIDELHALVHLGVKIPDGSTLSRHVEELKAKRYLKIVKSEPARNPQIRINFYDLTPRGFIAARALAEMQSPPNIWLLQEKHEDLADDFGLNRVQAFEKIARAAPDLFSHCLHVLTDSFSLSEIEEYPDEELSREYLDAIQKQLLKILHNGRKKGFQTPYSSGAAKLLALVKTDGSLHEFLEEGTIRAEEMIRQDLEVVDWAKTTLSESK